MNYFDEETHKYYEDSRELPSVTQLVSILGPETMDDDDIDMGVTMEQAAERGTVMHAYLAHRIKGGAMEDFELPDDYGGYADAVEIFLAEHSIAWVMVETPLYCEDYAGTPDLVAEFDDYGLCLLDYKFVSQLSKTKVGAQLNGYSLLLEQNHVFVERLFAVQFLKDGTYRIYPAGENCHDFSLCLDVYKAMGKKHPRGAIL